MRFPIDGNELAISNLQFERPHVVLLGAGASRAAFPAGDRNGRRLPVMNDFVDVLELREDLMQFGIKDVDRNFELIFQDIVRSDAGAGFQQEVERKICDYFASLELTHEPTLYDLIVLSLRKKDMVATFNWDPFLWAAACRVSRFVEVPYVAFLHGSVAVGYCEQHPVKGPIGKKCTKCGGTFQPARLFYPIDDKDYSGDKNIKCEWADLQHAMKAAYLFTVFGYSAPVADAAAVALLKAAWGDVSSRNLEQTEIIDIRSEDEIVKSWKPFIHTHHYHVYDDFLLSLAATYPRRSCEAFWSATMELQPYNTFEIPRPTSLMELIEWLGPLVEAERKSR
jgi:hypothetical protein